MSAFAIRPATPSDARDIAEIHYAGWRNAYGALVPPEQMAAKHPDRRVPFWQARIADAQDIVLIAHDATGRAQGFIHGGKVVPHDIRSGGLEGFDCEIYVLHCRKETQGKGLGRQLITEIAEQFQKRGGTAVMLWAYSDNAYRDFYNKLGGEVVAEGIDDGVADVAYGWRALDRLVASPQDIKTGAKPRPMEKA